MKFRLNSFSNKLRKTYLPLLIVIHAFYLLLFGLLFSRFNSYLFTPPAPPVEPVEILAWLPPLQFGIFAQGLFVLGLILIGMCALYPRSRGLRFFSTLALMLTVGISSSYGKVIHGYYGWLFASIALIFLPPINDAINTKKAKQIVQIIFCTQYSALMCYAMAGLWKLRYIPKVAKSDGWEGLITGLGNIIAYEHVTFAHPISPISEFFVKHDYITGFMFLGLVALQTLSAAFALFPRCHIFLGLLLILFHVLSEIIVHIEFRAHLYLIVLLFIVWPLMKKFSCADGIKES